jgi:hypothetical protein
MINEYLQSLISSKEILISTGASLIVILTLSWYLFKDRSSRLVSKILLGTLLTLVLNIFLLLIAYFIVFSISRSLNVQYLIVSILFFLFYFINLVIKFMVDIKNALFKGKKTGSLKESLDSIKGENASRVATLLVFLFIILLSIIAVGNGRINNLVVLLAISGILSSVSCIYFLPLFINISEKILK